MFLLAFVVVLFGGLAFMFFCISRNQEALLKAMREDHALMADRLYQIELRVAAGFDARTGSAEEAPAPVGFSENRSRTGNSSSYGGDVQTYQHGSAPTFSDARGGTVSHAAHTGSPLEEMNLQLEPTATATPSRSPRRENGLPDLKM